MKRTFAPKSLFFRIFLINLLLIFIAFSVMSVICYYRIYSYVRSEHTSSILTASSRVYETTVHTQEVYRELDELYEGNRLSPMDFKHLYGQLEESYHSILATISSSTGFSLIQVSPDGTVQYRYADIHHFEKDVITTDSQSSKKKTASTLHLSGPLKSLARGDVPDTLTEVNYNGELYYVTLGNLDGMFRETTLCSVKPIRNRLDPSQIASLLILYIPTPQINTLPNLILINLLLASCVSLLISAILSYALSYRIAKPLKDMNSAARKLASGDFSMRVNADKSTSEIHELISTFNAMADALQNSEENQRAFTASIAHELRTPMTSIIGFIDSILDGTISPEKSPEYLEICLSEARRLSRLVNDLMDVSRIENGTQKLECADFDINECIRRQIIKYEERISEKQLNVSVAFDTDECLCYCDKDAITRVIINLLDNAIKFSDPSGTISVDVSRRGGKAVVAIRNSGKGLLPEECRHIFDKFYKTDKSRGLDKQGIGLGLYLVKNILVLHHEEIRVTSEPGAYTEFSFTLPLSKTQPHK